MNLELTEKPRKSVWSDNVCYSEIYEIEVKDYSYSSLSVTPELRIDHTGAKMTLKLPYGGVGIDEASLLPEKLKEAAKNARALLNLWIKHHAREWKPGCMLTPIVKSFCHKHGVVVSCADWYTWEENERLAREDRIVEEAKAIRDRKEREAQKLKAAA